MSARLSRRTLLAGLAAMPALALVGCDDDRTSAAPISTAGTLDFANRLRIPALAESTMDHDGVRIFRLSASTGSAEFFAGVSSERACTQLGAVGSEHDHPADQWRRWERSP
jgi:hypothetical protein